MNYKKIYDQLIERGKNRVLEGYVERHHIIPRCMNGSDDISNLVALTPEEHFVSHQLLVKIYPDNHKLIWAASLLNKGGINNKRYGWIKRKRFGIARSRDSIEKQIQTVKLQYANGRTRKPISERHKQILSQANKGKIIPIRSRSSLEGYILRYGEEEGNRLYNEHKKKKDSASLQYYISKYGEEMGTILYDERSKQKSEQRSRLNVGFKHTDQSKQKMSESKIGRKIYRSEEHNKKISMANKGKIMPKSICPYCGKEGTTSNMIRWHFSNCKHKEL